MTSQFLQEAFKGRNRHWVWTLFTLACVFGAFIIGQAPLSMVISRNQADGLISSNDIRQFNESADFTVLHIQPLTGLVLLLLAFVIALAVLWVLVRYVHGRPLSSLIRSGNIQWKKVLTGLMLWLLLTAICEVIAFVLYPGSYRLSFDLSKWLPLMAVAVLLLPLQTSFEELFVRGYLLQRVGILFKKPWIAILMTSLFFAGMHLGNPEIEEFGAGIMITYYCSVGLSLAILTLLDDGLEYALGIHAATNIYGAGFVSYEGSALQTDALVKVGEVNPVLMVVLFYCSMILFYFIIKQTRGLGSWRLLTNDVVSIVNETTEPVVVNIHSNL